MLHFVWEFPSHGIKSNERDVSGNSQKVSPWECKGLETVYDLYHVMSINKPYPPILFTKTLNS